MRKYIILHLEDSKNDSELIKRQLIRSNLNIDYFWVYNKYSYIRALSELNPDVILCDHDLPQFNAPMALEIFKEMNINIPFILVTGNVSEEYAVDMIKNGVDDYILKDRISRLPLSIEMALEKKRIEKEKNEAIKKLKENEERFRLILKGSTDSYWDWDIENKKTYYSNAWWEMIGYENNNSNDPNITLKFVHPEDLDTFRIKMLEVLKSDKTTYHIEFRFLHKNGHYINVLSRSFINRDINGRAIRVSGTNTDLTEQEKAKEYLKKLSMIASKTNNLVVFTDTNHYITWVNEGFSKITEFSFQEVLGKKVGDLLQGLETNKETVNFIRNNLIEKKSFRCSILNYTKSKKKIWLDMEVNPIFDDNNKFIGFMSVETDITDLKNAELMLEQTNRVARIGGWEIDLINKKSLFSKITKEIYEVSYDFELNMDIVTNFYKEGENRDKISDATKKIIEDGIPYDLELKIITAKNNEIWIKNIGYAEFQNGVCIKIYGIVKDINHRKNNEKELENTKKLLLIETEKELHYTQEMLEQTSRIARIGAWESDHINKKVFWSKITKEIHEVSYDFEPTIELAMSFYKDSKTKDEIMAKIYECRDGRSFDIESKIISAKGTEIWVRIMGYPEINNGILTRIYGTLQDINEYKKNEQKLKDAKEEAEAGNKAKSEFIANISHEIKTPLTSIIGFSDLLQRTKLDDKQKKFVEMLNSSGIFLLKIINDILDFSKIEASKLELFIEKINLLDFINSFIDIVKFNALKKELELIINISPSVLSYIWTDSVRLKQVILNLLDNAIKYTDVGEIELKIEIINTDLNNITNFLFSIRDTGIGIKAKNHEIIFSPFSQEDSSTTKRFGGTGLGLSISKEILFLMKSNLKLKSIEGDGSCFYFEVSFKTEPFEEILFKDIAKNKSLKVNDFNFNSKEEFNGILKTNKKILIFTHNKRNNEVINNIFHEYELFSEESKNEFELIEKLSKSKYDTLILDDKIPNFIELIENIRNKLNLSIEKLKIILYCSINNTENINENLAYLSIQYVIMKPIKVYELIKLI
ncbi:MAG: PAS domain S-box protein [Cyanobacteriota bacterium]